MEKPSKVSWWSRQCRQREPRDAAYLKTYGQLRTARVQEVAKEREFALSGLIELLTGNRINRDLKVKLFPVQFSK